MTNIYLGEREYNALIALEGAQLSKTRWHWVWGGRRLSVDVFDEPLKGLVSPRSNLDRGRSTWIAPMVPSPMSLTTISSQEACSHGQRPRRLVSWLRKC